MKQTVCAVTACLALCGGACGVEVGEPAPTFSAPNSSGEEVSLEQFKGRWTVLYFYPKADTPGCTKQACSLRDGHDALREAGAVVVGVSVDSREAQAAFKQKYSLPFTLISDAGKEVASAYGVLPPGRPMAQRKTFIIDPEGNIAHVFDRVDVMKHREEVLKVLQQLEAAR